MKAKEAIAHISESKTSSAAGTKRKDSVDKGLVPKKEKKVEHETSQEAKEPSGETEKPGKEEPVKTGMA